MLGYQSLHRFNPLINCKHRTVQIIHNGTTHIIPVVKAYGNSHLPLSVDSADGDLHAVQSSSESIQMMSTPTTQHVMAHKALVVKMLSEVVVLPKKNSVTSAGYDLSSAVDTVVPANVKVIVPIGIAGMIIDVTFGRIAPRCGLAAKHYLAIGTGIIDTDYRVKVRIVIFDHYKLDFHVSKAYRIAQLLLERIASLQLRQFESLRETIRGSQGFGFSGLNVLTEYADIPSDAAAYISAYSASISVHIDDTFYHYLVTLPPLTLYPHGGNCRLCGSTIDS